ncbi:MAG: O-antigen ligase family protein [Ferruginibacter sp.]
MNISNLNIDKRFIKWLHKQFFEKKMMTPLGIFLLIAIAVGGGALAAIDLFFVPLLIGGLLIGIIVAYICVFRPLTGFYIASAFSIFIFYPNHLLGRQIVSLSPVLEVLFFLIFIGTYINSSEKTQVNSPLIKTLISISLILNTALIILQVFNPNVDTIAIWGSVFRRWLVFMMIYVVAYRLIDNREKLIYFIKFWIIAVFVIALYGCFQQWFGFLPMEMNFIMSVPGQFDLMNQGGNIRKFSFLSDVVSFGVICGSTAVLTLLIAIYTKKPRVKYTLIFFSMIMLLGMAYSGTRTTTVILPIGFIMYGFLTIQSKKTLITLFLGSIMALVVFFAPIYSNATLNRMRTTFDSKDESLNLRERNRHYIQPYLVSHPVGGGIGTTGELGAAEFPDHPLAKFPTDSGFLRIGLEMGWIGLIAWVFFNLAILWQSVIYYFRMKDPELKLIMVAFISCIFPILVIQYSQESIGQFPGSVFFFSVLSLMKRLLEFDEGKLSVNLN